MENDTFQFFPRPEASEMRWDDLLPPVRTAVRHLLVLLTGAESVRIGGGNEPPDVTSSFIIHGERGTGKTTVLKNARKAVCKKEGFFPEPPGRDNDEAKEAKKCAEELRRTVVWLDELDLEPLPSRANLLTTVLTRVSGALDSHGCRTQSPAPTTLFEEGADSARSQFSKLINDATVMWENVKEDNTREIANRYVYAAGIYARFRERFKEAMDKLAKELGRREGDQTPRAIILPIDNIDRSTEHLKNIIKLAELVSHPCLWLVMAGGREDIEAFLARAYWKELISLGEGAGALGRKETTGEDETLAMARRQAAAAAQKLWPPSHRVTIGFVKPEDTLRYKPSTRKPDDTNETIYALLCGVDIPTWLQKEPGKTDVASDKTQISLINLFIDLFEFGSLFCVADIENADNIKRKLSEDKPYFKHVRNQLADKLESLAGHNENYRSKEDEELLRALTAILDNGVVLSKQDLCDALNYLTIETALYEQVAQFEIQLSSETRWRTEESWPIKGSALPRLNRLLLEDMFRDESNRTIRPSPMALRKAAQQALRLPARSVLDLWQLAYWVRKDEISFRHLPIQAEQLARTMLRNLINESRISGHMSRHLQDDVIHNDSMGQTFLDFSEVELRVECVAMSESQMRLPFESPDCKVKSRVIVGQAADSLHAIRLINGTLEGELRGGEQLPEPVASWLSILYDILILSERLAVRHSATHPSPPMATSHAIIIERDMFGLQQAEREFRWSIPRWSTFRAHDIFWQRWGQFQRELKCIWDEKSDKALVAEALAAGWIHCVYYTFQAINPRHSDSYFCIRLLSEADVQIYMKKAFENMTKLYKEICKQPEVPDSQRLYFDSEAMCDWLERELPCFLSRLYLPSWKTPRGEAICYRDEVLSNMKTLGEEQLNSLFGYWHHHLSGIVANFDHKVAQLFDMEQGALEGARGERDEKVRDDVGYREFRNALVEQCELHQLLEYMKTNASRSSW